MATSLEIYRELENKLASLIGKVKFSAEINLRLERIGRLLQLLNNPHLQYPSIHIGGTSGKGSTATMTASILQQAGYKVGLHVSPHLQILNERHQINGRVAPSSDLLALLDEMMPAIEQVAGELPFGKTSYFEAQFALSCLYFARQKVDVVVVEVGLGGTLDATNVLPASVAVLTSVGLDHTEILGDTIEKIIADKAGIIKPGQTVITGVTQPSAHEIVLQRSRANGNPLWSIGSELAYEPNEDDTVNLLVNDRRFFGVELGLTGTFQGANAVCATAAALAFAPGLPEKAVYDGLRDVRFPGRMEVIQSNPTVVLDGAHNPDKMRVSAESIPLTQRIILVLGMKAGKDVSETLLHVVPWASTVVATQFSIKGLWKPVPTADIAAAVRTIAPKMTVIEEANPLAALETAITLAEDDDIVWVTGSLYLIGNLRERWYPIHQLVEQAEEGLSATLTF